MAAMARIERVLTWFVSVGRRRSACGLVEPDRSGLEGSVSGRRETIGQQRD